MNKNNNRKRSGAARKVEMTNVDAVVVVAFVVVVVAFVAIAVVVLGAAVVLMSFVFVVSS